jgi:hypothetical protein
MEELTLGTARPGVRDHNAESLERLWLRVWRDSSEAYSAARVAAGAVGVYAGPGGNPRALVSSAVAAAATARRCRIVALPRELAGAREEHRTVTGEGIHGGKSTGSADPPPHPRNERQSARPVVAAGNRACAPRRCSAGMENKPPYARARSRCTLYEPDWFDDDAGAPHGRGADGRRRNAGAAVAVGYASDSEHC